MSNRKFHTLFERFALTVLISTLAASHASTVAQRASTQDARNPWQRCLSTGTSRSSVTDQKKSEPQTSSAPTLDGSIQPVFGAPALEVAHKGNFLKSVSWTPCNSTQDRIVDGWDFSTLNRGAGKYAQSNSPSQVTAATTLSPEPAPTEQNFWTRATMTGDWG